MDPASFSTFGELLRYLRRGARLTQRDLGIAVGYSEGHINRFEKNKHLPDPAAVTALFIPALHLAGEPLLAARLVELAQAQPPQKPTEPGAGLPLFPLLEQVPLAPPFQVARPQALERLRQRLNVEHRILLSGMAGVGKTTLAAALARDAAAARPVFWLTFSASVTTSVDTLIHQLALFLSEHGSPQLKALLQTAPQLQLASDRSLAMLSAALNRQPALLCFDNAEVIAQNEAVLQVLRHLCATTPIEMVLTSRVSLPLVGICECTLAGLEQPEGVALVRALSEQRLSLEQAARLFEKTGGNPMLIRLAVAHLMDGEADVPARIERLDTQPQMAAFLLETVQKQSTPAEWGWLSLLAVFFKPVDLYDERLIELADALGAASQASDAILSLQRRHLIDDANRAELNPLVQDFIYRSLGADARRRRLHRLAGDWYAGIPAAALSAATHYAEADLLDETVEAIAQGEKEIIARGEALAAVAVLDQVRSRQAGRRPLTDDALRRLLTVRGVLLTATSRAAEAEANLRQALALTANPALRADLVYRMRMILGQRGRYTDALQLILAAEADLAPADLLLRAQLFVAESSTWELIGEMAEARRSAESAIALANQVAHFSPISAEEIRAEAYYVLANVARRARQVDTSIEYAQCALSSASQASQRIREVACLSFIGGMLYDSGDLDGSLHYRREALAGAQAIEDQVGAGYYLTHLADIDILRLQAGDALKKLDLAISILSDTGELRGLASALSISALASLQQGNLAQAAAAIQRVLNKMEGQATQRGWAAYLNRLAMLQLVEGKAAQAQATLERAIRLPPVAGDPMLHFELASNLALAQALAGDPLLARGTLDGAPRIDGLSIWVELDRDLIEACLAYAAGELQQAAALAAQTAQQSRAYPLYQQSARRLSAAVRDRPPAAALPRLLWVGID